MQMQYIFVKLGIKTQVLGQLITIASVSGQLSMLYLYTANLFITQLEPSVMATKWKKWTFLIPNYFGCLLTLL